MSAITDEPNTVPNFYQVNTTNDNSGNQFTNCKPISLTLAIRRMR